MLIAEVMGLILFLMRLFFSKPLPSKKVEGEKKNEDRKEQESFFENAMSNQLYGL